MREFPRHRPTGRRYPCRSDMLILSRRRDHLFSFFGLRLSGSSLTIHRTSHSSRLFLYFINNPTYLVIRIVETFRGCWFKEIPEV